MRVTLLLGFLGAGKTTLLQKLFEHSGGNEKVAVIVNEFGAVGVDGDILAGRAIDTIELASGCICCSLKGAMTDAIVELVETAAPDRLLIEASGVAQPDDAVAALLDPALAGQVELGPVITIVDAARFRRMVSSLGPFYAEQVARADIVLVNKIDLAAAKEVEAVRAEIAALNPQAAIVFTERCDIDIAVIFEGLTHYQPLQMGGAVKNHDHTDLISFVFDLISDLHRNDINMIFRSLPAGVFRAKGFVRIDGQSHLIQYAAPELEITPVEERERHYLVLIGQELDRSALMALFTGVSASSGGSSVADTRA